VTSDLIKRAHEHKNDLHEGFTKIHRVHILIWFEQHDTMESAISSRDGHQGMEAFVEARTDREIQPILA
jgi:putative endonuclease